MVSLRLCVFTRVFNLFTAVTYLGFTVVVYIIFIIVVDSSAMFQGYKTAGTGLLNFKFFLILVFCLAVILVIETLTLILSKEIWTPLSTYYISIIQKGRENEVRLFENLIMHIKRKNKLK